MSMQFSGTVAINELLCLKMRAPRSHCFSPHMNNRHLWQLKKSSPFTSEVGPNGLNWQWCLAGSSKTAPRILIFSIAIGADYSFDIKSGFSIAPAFSLHNNFDIASVSNFAKKKFDLLILNRLKTRIKMFVTHWYRFLTAWLIYNNFGRGKQTCRR